MQFGIDLYPIIAAELSGPVAFEYAVKQVQAAHAAGFDGIFASHHYLTGHEQMFQPLPLLARLAAEGPGMRFGTAVYLLGVNNAVDAAEQAATLDIITGGRFVLGLGQGYRDVEFAAFSVPKAERGPRLEEGVAVIRRLWAEDKVTFHGRYYHLEKVTANPKPVQRPGPPIWVGGDTLKGVERAARVADAWLTSPRHSKGYLREAVATWRRVRAETGQPDATPVFFREMHVAPDRAAADRLIMAAFERLYHTFYHREKQPGEDYSREFAELKRDRIIVGDPDDVAAEIARYHEEFGAEYMFFRIYYPGMDPEVCLRVIELFGKEVLPRFRD